MDYEAELLSSFIIYICYNVSMRFIEIDEETFRDFSAQSPYKSFMQTPEIAHLRERSGWTIYYFGVKKDQTLVGASMVVAKPTFLGKSVFYAPGGPLLDLEDQALTNFFFKNLKRYIKSHNGYTLHIDPYYELIQRDRDGLPVEGGFNHTKVLQTLRALGFRPIQSASQPKYLFALDLDNRSPEELLASFKRNTRNHIKKAEKMGVKVRELKRDDLERLKKITKKTSARRGFSDQPLSYYESMYDLFTPVKGVKFLLAEADGHDLSAAMFITYGDEIIYLFSGSDEEYMRKYNAQYELQWHMIKYAAKHNYKRYNFYGISGLPDKNDPDYGIYDFKKGFGGQVIELVGSFELPVSPLFYFHSLLSRLKSKLSHK